MPPENSSTPAALSESGETGSGRESRRLAWHWNLAIGLLVAALLLCLLEGLLSSVWLVVDLRKILGAERIVQRPVEEIHPGENLESYHSQYDEELGWIHIPGRMIKDFYGPGLDMTINNDGLRGTADYIGHKQENVFRVVFLGDSMTMGYGVDDADSYPAQFGDIHPRVEAINMGMGGYSVAQCDIWYRRLHEELEADLLVFAFIANDVERMMTQPPKYQVVDGLVQVVNRPVPRFYRPTDFEVEAFRLSRFLVDHNSIARTISRLVTKREEAPIEPSRDPLKLTRRIIREMASLTRDSGQEFAVVLLPHSGEIPGHKWFSLEHQRTFWVVSRLVEKTARRLDIPYLNLLPIFAARAPADLEDLFLAEIYGHYSPAGNALIATSIDEWLEHEFPDYALAAKAPAADK